MYDAVVVGASVAGSRTAKLIADKGHKVLLIEEHKKIGLPNKCTGLVSHRLLEQLPNLPKKIILNKPKKARFYSPNGNCLELKSKHPVYVIDRPAFDRFLFDEAKKSGVETRTERFESFLYGSDSVKVRTNKKTYDAKILIGADGANSLVRKQARLDYPKNILTGIQTTVKGDFDYASVELWFGSKICPNFFAWVVPENENTARVGLATNSNVARFYDNFLKKRVGYKNRPNVGGLISYGLMKETCDKRLMLIGDAACMVKPFSGGGVIYGLITSRICSDVAVRVLEKNRFDKKFFKQNYDAKWKNKLALPIIKGLLMRKFFNKLPDNGFNFLFYSVSHAKKFLEDWDMDLL